MINIAQPADDFNFLFRQLTGNKDYEKIIYKNIKEAAGRAEGRTKEIFLSVQEHDYSVERGAQKLGLSVGEFVSKMESSGYQVPEE